MRMTDLWDDRIPAAASARRRPGRGRPPRLRAPIRRELRRERGGGAAGGGEGRGRGGGGGGAAAGGGGWEGGGGRQGGAGAGGGPGGGWGTGSSLAAFRRQVNAFTWFFLLDTPLPAPRMAPETRRAVRHGGASRTDRLASRVTTP